MKKIKIAGVSYLNTKPFLYGINKLMKSEIELTVQHPSKLAEQLKNNEVDIALVPVSIIPFIPESRIITDYCIGCDGEVGSVVICSQVPIEKAENIFLDYQSRTSAMLTKVLLQEFLHLRPTVINTSPGFESEVKNTSAGLFIGDRALILRKQYEFVYDLGILWKQFTQRPFVFACWVTSKKLSSDFENEFNIALSLGITKLDQVIKEEQIHHPEINVQDYLSHKIQFVFDEKKKEALQYFFSLSKSIQ